MTRQDYIKMRLSLSKNEDSKKHNLDSRLCGSIGLKEGKVLIKEIDKFEQKKIKEAKEEKKAKKEKKKKKTGKVKYVYI